MTHVQEIFTYGRKRAVKSALFWRRLIQKTKGLSQEQIQAYLKSELSWCRQLADKNKKMLLEEKIKEADELIKFYQKQVK